jgi:interferon gamma-inducible protein 30
MLPYGNAHGTGTAIECQHGATECKINMVEDCAIKHLADNYMPFVFCAESHATKLSPDDIISTCADASVATDISKCYGEGTGQEGASLQTATATKTKATNHKYTPWVMINDEHSTAAESDLKKAVCAAYKGPNPPAACAKSLASENGNTALLNKCYASENEIQV